MAERGDKSKENDEPLQSPKGEAKNKKGKGLGFISNTLKRMRPRPLSASNSDVEDLDENNTKEEQNLVEELGYSLTSQEIEVVKLKITKILQNRKKREKLFMQTDKLGQTILHVALQKLPELVPLILKKKGDALINQKDNYGTSPLGIAAKETNEPLVIELLEGGAFPDTTALYYFSSSFCSPNCEAIMKMMIEGGADINGSIRSGNTPLHGAVVNLQIDHVSGLEGSPLMAGLLLQYGANVNVKNNRGAAGAEIDLSPRDPKRFKTSPTNNRVLSLMHLTYKMREELGSLADGEEVVRQLLRHKIHTLAFDALTEQRLRKMDISNPESIQRILSVKNKIAGSSQEDAQISQDPSQETEYYLVGETLLEPLHLWNGSNIIGRKQLGVKDESVGDEQLEIIIRKKVSKKTVHIRLGTDAPLLPSYVLCLNGQKLLISKENVEMHEGDKINLSNFLFIFTLVSVVVTDFPATICIDFGDWLEGSQLSHQQRIRKNSKNVEKLIDQRLSQFRLYRREYGNSTSHGLFDDFSLQLFDTTDRSASLRTDAVNWLKSNSSWKLGFDEYLEWVLRGGRGDGLTLLGLVQSHGVPTTLITDRESRFVVHIQPTTTLTTRHVLLSQRGEGSYEALERMVEDPSLAEWQLGVTIERESLHLQHLLGKGSSGEVYYATWNNFTVCAKKIIQNIMEGKKRDAFLRETRMLAKLRHPNIILFMGTMEKDNSLYIVTEYMANGSLSDLLGRMGPLPWGAVPRMAQDIAQGMNYLHSYRPTIIHRDLKSGNILVDKDFNLKICDFGVAKFLPRDQRLNRSLHSTIPWTAPESLREEGYSERSDVFSYGIVLWTLLTGKEPHVDKNEFQIVVGVISKDINLRPEIPPETHPSYESLMKLCWDYEPLQRPEFSQILELLAPLQDPSISLTTLLSEHSSSTLTDSNSSNQSISRSPSMESTRDSPRDYPKAKESPRELSQETSPLTPKRPNSAARVTRRNQNRIPDEPTSSSPSSSSSSSSPSSPSSAPLSSSSLWTINPEELVFDRTKDEIGSGCSAVVYKGLYRGQPVAIKCLIHTPDKKEFEKELNIFCQLRSPDVPYFYGAFTEPQYTLVTEYLRKGSLLDVMEDPTFDFDWLTVVDFSKQIVEALGRLHNWKPPVVHRDIKSKNLLVDHKNNVKVADLGLARFTSFDNSDTLFKARGSLAYMAPEVWTSSSTRSGLGFTTKSDIYSFGIVLWEMVHRCLTGEWRMPYPNRMPFEVITKVATENLRPVPEPFVNMMKACWDASPLERPSCEELAQKIQKISLDYPLHKEEWNRIKMLRKRPKAARVVQSANF